MQLSVRHVTTYSYAAPARGLIQLLRATPVSFAGLNVLDWRIDVDCDARLREGRDGYGNVTHMLYVDKPVGRLSVSVSGRVLTEDRAGIVQGLPYDLPPQVFLRATPLTEAGPAIAGLARMLAAGPDPALGRLHALNARLYETMRFDTEATAPDTTAEQACAAGHGVCQDFAHMFVAAARLLRIPARYISGHLFRRDGAHVQEASHAWAEAWVGDLGWVAFDPANGISADDAYVRIACGLDYRDAAPVAGTRSGGGKEHLAVEVAVSQTQQQAQFQSQS
ncbi:MAG: transglutaminase family protein [Alphaproteobacteria bacterium]|nr:MAG: transglutaminase family protein [Alphaproteobacteria bacterium]